MRFASAYQISNLRFRSGFGDGGFCGSRRCEGKNTMTGPFIGGWRGGTQTKNQLLHASYREPNSLFLRALRLRNCSTCIPGSTKSEKITFFFLLYSPVPSIPARNPAAALPFSRALSKKTTKKYRMRRRSTSHSVNSLSDFRGGPCRFFSAQPFLAVTVPPLYYYRICIYLSLRLMVRLLEV